MRPSSIWEQCALREQLALISSTVSSTMWHNEVIWEALKFLLALFDQRLHNWMLNSVFGFEVISANSLYLANIDGPTIWVFYFIWYFVLEKIGSIWTGNASLRLRVWHDACQGHCTLRSQWNFCWGQISYPLGYLFMRSWCSNTRVT